MGGCGGGREGVKEEGRGRGGDEWERGGRGLFRNGIVTPLPRTLVFSRVVVSEVGGKGGGGRKGKREVKGERKGEGVEKER